MSYWTRRTQPNILFITFEEMKRDLPSVIRRTAAFLNKTLTDEQVDRLTDHLSFKNMKSNKAVNKEEYENDGRFMRKGETGDWRSKLSEEQVRIYLVSVLYLEDNDYFFIKVERIIAWEQRQLQGTDLKFTYEL